MTIWTEEENGLRITSCLLLSSTVLVVDGIHEGTFEFAFGSKMQRNSNLKSDTYIWNGLE